MALIGINGYINSGKDTVAMMIRYLSLSWYNHKEIGNFDNFAKGNFSIGIVPAIEWETHKFAGKLKQIASILTGISSERFEDQEFKKTFLGPQWNKVADVPTYSMIDGHRRSEFKMVPMTVREFLQRLGTEAIREELHQEAWVNAAFAFWTPEQNWIFSDMRFPNEYEAIKSRGGITIRIERFKSAEDKDGPGGTHLHPSEIALDNFKFDYTIRNFGTLGDLLEQVKDVMAAEKLLTLPF